MEIGMGAQESTLWPYLRRTLVLGIIMLWPPSGALACGYHGDISLARGLLNWVYPDALHVVGAISAAVAERRLPAPATMGRGLLGYHGIVRSLERHGQQLDTFSSETTPPTVSLVLIESMLWTRFFSESGGLRMHAHVSGPQVGDLVMISGEDIIREIANNRLSVGEAYRYKLLRLYGTEEQIALFLNLYHQIGRARSGG
jgi:hypothetical protein